jgi:hypothetical protein
MKRQSCHWGWYWQIKKQYKPKTLCSSYDKLDSFELFSSKEGIVACMNKVFLTMPPYKLNAILHENCIVIALELQGIPINYSITIEKNACNYGGARYYFHCPKCNIRMRILYCHYGYFACRKCLKLGYWSQRLRPTRRYQYMSKKVEDFVKNRGGNISLYRKPPHMHNSSYQKLSSKQFYYEAKSHQATNKEVRLWFGAKAEPYLDGFFDYVDESKEWRK